jgi:hypothetical protein
MPATKRQSSASPRCAVQTANHGELTNYVIDAKADEMLSELSNEFSEVVLRMAASMTENRTESDVPLVTVCNIADAAEVLCHVVTEALKKQGASEHERAALCSLQGFCKTFLDECNRQSESDE